MTRAGATLVRTAVVADTEVVFGLKQAAFATTTLPYTIYQAPQAVHYLRQLIGGSSATHHFDVAVQGMAIVGYCHALQQEDTFFLNYIATADTVRGQGVGAALLSSYERTGANLGCRQLALDALSSNEVVQRWYQRRGYRPQARFFHVRLAVAGAGAAGSQSGDRLQWEAAAWQSALQTEAIRGFSTVAAFYRATAVQLGLIGGQLAKLLKWQGLTLAEIAPAAIHALQDQRQALLISNLPELPLELPIIDFLEVQRLVKVID
jgi:ribosomal protein S18 acetylase RimI-like enzyme